MCNYILEFKWCYSIQVENPVRIPETSKTVQVIATALGCPPEIDDKTVIKTSYV